VTDAETTAVEFPIETERLRLRLYEPGDLEATLAYYSQPEVARYLLTGPWTREIAEQTIAKRVTRRGIDKDHGELALVIEHEGTVVGDIAFWTSDETHSRAEIGWVLDPAYGGRGYATEAVRAVLGLAFGAYGMHRVHAQLDARNTASERLCERVGMKREAHLREDWWSKGEWTDTFVYGILAREWAG
jgi:aminoglycoside 6'-N-acetyltransferase